jgi:hypothetical protein
MRCSPAGEMHCTDLILAAVMLFPVPSTASILSPTDILPGVAIKILVKRILARRRPTFSHIYRGKQ